MDGAIYAEISLILAAARAALRIAAAHTGAARVLVKSGALVHHEKICYIENAMAEGCFDYDVNAALTLVHAGEKQLRGGRSGSSVEARRLFEEALEKDYSNKAAKFALKALLWWQRYLEGAPSARGTEKGMAIVDRWEGFYHFLDGIGNVDRDALGAVRHWVSAAAFEAFDYNELNPSQSGDWELQFKLGLCCKGLGDYENAVVFFDTAAGFKQDNIALLFERADAKALAGSDGDARLIFREAFLADPQEARVYSMESALFCELYRAVGERGYGEDEILEWMPVWGMFLGVFPLKCELNQVKRGKLNTQVFELENVLKTEGGPGSRSLDKKLIPRLLNRYFWLVGHYEVCRIRESSLKNGEADRYEGLINETLLKIKYIDIDDFIYRPFWKMLVGRNVN
jgi:tetratricopeptide (TPR) repeat protein